MSNAIRQNEWREFLKAFWQEHKNSRATLEIREHLAACGIVSSGRRLNGLDVERFGDDIVVAITVGDLQGVQQVRTIRNPVSIRYIPEPASACETVGIECSDGTDTFLTAENQLVLPREFVRSASADERGGSNNRFASAHPRSAL